MRSHSWNEENSKVPAKPPYTLPPDSPKNIISNSGPNKSTNEHKDPNEKSGFNYITIIVELMYCYVSCRPDIGYSVTILSKLSSTTSDYHYSFLKNISRYLSITRYWGIRCKIRRPWLDLPETKYHSTVWDKNNPKPKQYIDKGELIYFLDAAEGNETTKRRCTTGLDFTLSGGVVVYRSKTKPINVLSSTEAHNIAAVIAAKNPKILGSMLWELGFTRNLLLQFMKTTIIPLI